MVLVLISAAMQRHIICVFAFALCSSCKRLAGPKDPRSGVKKAEVTSTTTTLSQEVHEVVCGAHYVISERGRDLHPEPFDSEKFMMLIVGQKTVENEMSRRLISASMSELSNEDALRSFKKNSDVSAQYKDYLQVQNLIEAGYSFCEFMKTYNYGDIKATGMSDIDCDSHPPNWKFKDRLVQPYWDTWATCWNGLKSRIKPDLNVDPFTATEHRLHNEQKKIKIELMRGNLAVLRKKLDGALEHIRGLDSSASHLAESMAFKDGELASQESVDVDFADFEQQMFDLDKELQWFDGIK